MYHALLVLHLLAAFAAVATVVLFSAFEFGWTRDGRILGLANVLWAIGSLGTIGFGIWLALRDYSITDGWIIAGIVLWAGATELGRRAQVGYTEVVAAGPPPPGSSTTAGAGHAQLWHWARSLAILALLVVMIYKPGA